MNNKQKILDKLFSDPSTGLFSAQKLLPKAKKLNKDIKLSDIQNYLNKQEAVQLNKTINKPKFKPIVAPHVNANWQIDLMDYKAYKKVNAGYSFIMTCVDIYSRRAWAIPMKKKDAYTIIKSFQQILKDGKPKNLTSDNGTEFKSNHFENYLKKSDIKHYLHEVGDHNVMGIIERFNRTLRNMIRKWWSLNRTKTWHNVIDKLINNYNTTIHNTIKQEPMLVYTGVKLPDQPFKDLNVQTREFNVGDSVRLIKKKKNIFTKVHENLSRQIYIITRKLKNSYRIKPEGGSELKKSIKVNDMVRILPIHEHGKFGRGSSTGTDFHVLNSRVGNEKIADEDIKKQRQTRALNKAGLDRSNIISTRQKRNIKPRQILDL